jgi:uncharacterized protein (DUF362 family)
MKPLPLTRRQFLRASGALAASAVLWSAGCSSSPQAGGTAPAASAGRVPPPLPTGDQAYVGVARGDSASAITEAALKAVGGIERFVKAGQTVVIKPNICVDYHTAEYAATTNPDVVAALVKLCLGAGAKRVRVMDMPFGGTPESAYAISGIGDAVKAAGGEMEVMSQIKFTKTSIPNGKDLKTWDIYRDALEADVLIDVPIAKHHSLARLTLGGKNLLGLASTPNEMHQNLGQRIADLISVIRPTLTVVDGYRILVAHGPTGGSLNDVKPTHTVIASHDIVAADAYGATLFNLTGADIAFVKAAADMGLGTLDLKSVKVTEVNV